MKRVNNPLCVSPSSSIHMASWAVVLLNILFNFMIVTDVTAKDTEYQNGKFPLLMPNVHPYRAELYVCTPIKVDYTRNYYIVGFEPNATMHTAHHMLLYGCGEPGSNLAIWNCGEMAQSDVVDDELETASPCGVGSHSQIIYAWARDAPKLELPEDVGFKVGKSSQIKYLVLQVHYVEKFKDGGTDDSGIFISYTTKPLQKLAGVLLLGTSGVIEAMQTEHMESACELKENKTIYPIAYRGHTHALGRVVSGYRIRKENGHDKWTLLGKRNPLKPQMFYPMENSEPIVPGDIVASRCTMESNRNRPTYIGATNDDEMCNFYLMYYVKNGEPLEMKYCFSRGPPAYHWTKSDMNFELDRIPEREASLLEIQSNHL